MESSEGPDQAERSIRRSIAPDIAELLSGRDDRVGQFVARYAPGGALSAAVGLHAAREFERLEAAAAVAEAEADRPDLRVLVAAREYLRMDVAFLGQFKGAVRVIQRLDGDAHSLGLKLGGTVSLDSSHVKRIVEGSLPNLIRDVRCDERIDGTDPALGSYVTVPVIMRDGRVYGVLACMNQSPAPWLRERDLAYMRVLARMLADDLDRRERQREGQRHRDEAIALSALLAALDARDSYTSRHCEAVVNLAVRVAGELGLSQALVEESEQVALLHDIGKIAMPDAILHKPGPLDEAEWKVMCTHSTIGSQIVASISALDQLAPAIRAGHERCDGNGYPDGLTREQIPLASRITFACDAYDAMISSRPYRADAMDAITATKELRDNAGTQSDPDVVAALLRALTRPNTVKRSADERTVPGIRPGRA